MKRMIFPFWVLGFFIFYSCGTKTSKAESPKTDYYISMTGLDSLKLGMSKAELETMLGTSFNLKHIHVDGGPYDTFSTKYKGVDIQVYLNESDDQTVATLYGILSSDTSCRTAGGIGIGTEKAKVIDAYENHTKYIAPAYENYPIRSKTKSVIAVMDTVESRALLFHIMNGKVSSIELSSYYEFY